MRYEWAAHIPQTFDQRAVTLIYRGLISDTRSTGQRLSGEKIDKARLVEGYCSRFAAFGLQVPGYPAGTDPHFTL